MLTPGELHQGIWVMVHSLIKEDAETPWQESQPENILGGLFLAQIPQSRTIPDYPFLILNVELPYVVVADVLKNPYGTYIWDMREYNLMEVSPEFVQSYTAHGYATGMKILQSLPRPSTK